MVAATGRHPVFALVLGSALACLIGWSAVSSSTLLTLLAWAGALGCAWLLPVYVWVALLAVAIPWSFGTMPALPLGFASVRPVDAVLLGLLVSICLRSAGRKFRLQGPLVMVTGLFLAAQLLALGVAHLHGATWGLSGATALARLAEQLVAMLCLAGLVNTGAVEKSVRWFATAGLLVTATVPLQWAMAGVGWAWGNTYGDRYTGIFGDPAQASVVACLFILIGAAHLLQRRSGLVMMAVGLLAVILTGTRGTMIILGGGLVILPLIGSRLAWFPRIRWPILLGGGGILGLALMAGPLLQRMRVGISAGDFHNRLDPMIRAWRMFVANPWLGLGYTGSGEVYAQYQGFLPYYRSGTYNEFLRFGADSGIVGLIAFLLLLGVVTLALLRRVLGDQVPSARQAFALGATAWVLVMFWGYQTESWWEPGSCMSFVAWVVVGLVLAWPAPPGPAPDLQS